MLAAASVFWWDSGGYDVAMSLVCGESIISGGGGESDCHWRQHDNRKSKEETCVQLLVRACPGVIMGVEAHNGGSRTCVGP